MASLSRIVVPDTPRQVTRNYGNFGDGLDGASAGIHAP